MPGKNASASWRADMLGHFVWKYSGPTRRRRGRNARRNAYLPRKRLSTVDTPVHRRAGRFESAEAAVSVSRSRKSREFEQKNRLEQECLSKTEVPVGVEGAASAA